MSRVETTTERVDRQPTSDQKRRRCTTALAAAEQQFWRVKGCVPLLLLERVLATYIIPLRALPRESISRRHRLKISQFSHMLRGVADQASELSEFLKSKRTNPGVK